MANNKNNVTFAKPKITGAIYYAPLGTALPTDAAAELDKGFVCVGYISEDGVTNSNNAEDTAISAWGGDKVLHIDGPRDDDWKFKMIEYLNDNVLKAVYGDDNVTGTLSTGITVKAGAESRGEHSWVIDKILRDNAISRTVIPDGKLTNLDDISYTHSDAVGFPVTISAMPDNNGNTHYEYIKYASAI